jgi:molecular chaperone IbpA
MSYVRDVFGRDLQLFDKFFVGFDDQFNKMTKLHDELTKNIPNYPPYNIKKVDENKYMIELAVAGFGRSDIEIEMVDDKLVIRGHLSSDERETEKYMYQGIANRAFTRMFALGDHIEVKDAEMINGMLQVFLEKIIPEHKKPRKIEVGEPTTTKKIGKGRASKELLQETHDKLIDSTNL